MVSVVAAALLVPASVVRASETKKSSVRKRGWPISPVHPQASVRAFVLMNKRKNARPLSAIKSLHFSIMMLLLVNAVVI